MATPAVSNTEYWGYLIKPDKTPAPLFEQLLLGIANYINKHVTPWDIRCLTPNKLASFYRLVGGNFDVLFLDTPHPSLSFIYQSLGCFQSLQPDTDPYKPPTIPALTPDGFVRWQTVQLLLCPEEHVPLLQEAVKRFEIKNPSDGYLFPSTLPKSALPTQPDAKMTEWHESVSKNLKLEMEAQQSLGSSDVANIDREPNPSNRQFSIEEQSMNDTSNHSYPNRRPGEAKSPNIEVLNLRPKPRYASSQPWRPSNNHIYHFPRGSGLDSHSSGDIHISNDGRPTTNALTPHARNEPRSETPSTLSITSGSSDTDDDSSSTTSSVSHSPVAEHRTHHSQLHPSTSERERERGRRHSAHTPYDSRDFGPPQQRQIVQPPQQSYFPEQQPASAPPRGNARGLNVRWREANEVWTLPGSTPSTPGTPGRHDDEYFTDHRKDAYNRRSRSASGSRRIEGPVRGVGGRRYVPDGTLWK